MSEITSFEGKIAATDEASFTEAAVSELMGKVGDRVREARLRKNIPRRVLSEASGVSPRYLAQLEAGEGNISIGLLKRVAMALDHKIEWLVGEEDPWQSDALRIAHLYRSADQSTQLAVMRALNADSLDEKRGQRVCLVGLRGAGKSTLGSMISNELGVPFLELNKEISLYGGMPIDEIQALYGPDGYRKLEASSLDRVIENYDRVILAVAGGIVAEPETYGNLLSHFHTIWLRASPTEHMDRVRAQGDERPMAGHSDAMEQLKSILQSREPLYARAEAQLDTSGVSVETSMAQLLGLIEKRQFLAD